MRLLAGDIHSLDNMLPPVALKLQGPLLAYHDELPTRFKILCSDFIASFRGKQRRESALHYLPPELWLIIIQQLVLTEAQRDLRSLGRACRALRTFVQPHLYEVVDFQTSISTFYTPNQFKRTARTRRIVKRAKKMEVCQWVLPFVQRLNLTSDREWEPLLHENAALDCFLRCVPQMQNLEALSITHAVLHSRHHQQISRVRQLSTINLDDCYLPPNFLVSAKRVSISRLRGLHLRVDPLAVEVLSMRSFYYPLSPDTLSSSRQPFSRLRSLSFDNTVFSELRLQKLFRSMPMLEELHFVSPFHADGWMDESLQECLDSCRASVRKFTGPAKLAVAVAHSATLQEVEIWDDGSPRLANDLIQLAQHGKKITQLRLRVYTIDEMVLDTLPSFKSLERLDVSACFAKERMTRSREVSLGY